MLIIVLFYYQKTSPIIFLKHFLFKKHSQKPCGSIHTLKVSLFCGNTSTIELAWSL